MAVTLSLAMIVKDEELVIERILAHAKTFCDELVVVDTGSTDKTVELAERLGAKVVHFPWVNDFSAARNHAFAQCSGDWIVWLDADDVIPESEQAKIRELKASVLTPDLDAVICNYNIAFSQDGKCTMAVPRERFIRRDCGGHWEYPIHEAYIFQGYYQNRLDIAIEHRKPPAYYERCNDRNLNMLARLIEQGEQSPRIWYYYGKELHQHARPKEAREAFLRHIELNTDDNITRYQAMHDVMVCSMDLEEYDEALDWSAKAIRVDSSRAEAFAETGVIYYRRGEYAKAIPLLMAATYCTRPSTGLILEENYSWRPYHYLSLCYEGLGECEKAIEMALKAFPLIPDKKVIRDNIACYAGKIGLNLKINAV
jgi:glycosyltransferase involved in cell wall biosynthesis